ncbi:MAG: amidohydrolase family protein [Nakamurella sp.]
MTLTVFRNGRIHTSADPDATAMAIDGSVISWIGGEHAIALAGTPDLVVDLDGALVVPGFVDAHVHSTDAGLALTGLDLSATRSLTECLAALRDFAARHQHGVLWGHGWEQTRWPENRAPSRAELDAAVGNRAMYLSRVDVHSALISTALADQLPGGVGLPGWSTTGPVTRQAHHAVRGFARQQLSDRQRTNAQMAFLRSAAANGITEVHECAQDDVTGRADLAGLLALSGPIPVRGYLAAAITDPEQAGELLAATGAHALGGDLTVDGAIGSHTAALSSPYLDNPDSCGARYLAEQQIADHLLACTLAGVQAGFHAIGDDAVSAVAAALREVMARLGENATVRLAGCAHRIEHAEMIDDAAIGTLAATGMVASMQPLFDAAWGGPDGLYSRRLGPDRAAAMNPFATMATAGIALAFGSDAPVTPADPWAAVQAAAHHRTPGSEISPRAAFTAHTRGGHRAAGRTDRGIGTIGVGAPAHLAIVEAGQLVRPAADPKIARWSTDPRSRVPLLPDLTPGVTLPRTLATIVAGNVVFDDAGLFGGRG